MIVEYNKTAKERLKDLLLQREYLENIEFDYIDEETINKAIEKVDEDINKLFEEINNENL